MKRRVVVTGMGIVSPISCKVDDCWQKILAGDSGIVDSSVEQVDRMRARIAGHILNWDTTGYIEPREAKRIDRFTQFAMVAGTDAVSDTGLDFESLNPWRGGVIMGSGIGGLITIHEQMSKLFLKGPERVSPLTIPKLMLNAAGGNLSIKYGLRGPNYSVATACASATNAMGNALEAIRENVIDVCITGGSEAAITPIAMAAFGNMRALSERNDEPAKASRPFDNDRDGFVLAEGAGIMVFEEMEHALARGATIHGEVLGFGATGDAGHITQPSESGEGAAEAMRLAIQDAGMKPEQVDYINAHGTSTPLGDKAETVAMKKVFGDHAYKLAVSSTKSMLGHSLGASGGIEAVLCVKAINENLVPPTINLETPDPDCDLDYTPNVPQARELNVTMSNSFGFGGHNASIMIGRFKP
ncbi:MAG: beta-ketoacyl-ACP synthase II [Pirellulaceae bacterium]|nr:beta-ketoacyl-ACP synthase II [Pirellulaceae bacterium]